MFWFRLIIIRHDLFKYVTLYDFIDGWIQGFFGCSLLQLNWFMNGLWNMIWFEPWWQCCVLIYEWFMKHVLVWAMRAVLRFDLRVVWETWFGLSHVSSGILVLKVSSLTRSRASVGTLSVFLERSVTWIGALPLPIGKGAFLVFCFYEQPLRSHRVGGASVGTLLVF